jgi:hypothetical protein
MTHYILSQGAFMMSIAEIPLLTCYCEKLQEVAGLMKWNTPQTKTATPHPVAGTV